MADPPARVGRLNLISGTVSYRPASVNDWTAAEPNRTLTAGDALWTDLDSRAEAHVGSTAIRLAAQTELDVLNLDDQTVQGRLAVGTLTVRIRNLDQAQVYEIDTPNGAVSLASVGEYRIDVAADGTQSKVTVWAGQAEVTAAGSSFEVRARQVATISGTDAPTFDLADVGPYDDWDNWCVGRDLREENAKSWRYVSREMPGYEDLDEYGRWRFVAGYGDVWFPVNTPPGWAPYSTGHWVWTEPWGWTWVDEAPWGFAPYHYGRWANFEGSWMWCPHAYGARVTVVTHPVFAPALVAFIGGPSWRLTFEVGNLGAVAWVPLGPSEVYRPAYPVSESYLRQVNVTNVTNVTNITVVNNTTINNITTYRNATVPGAVRAMSQNAMATGQSATRTAVPVTHQQLASAPAARFGAPVAPTREALLVSNAAVHGNAGVRIATPPAPLAGRRVMAVVAPPPPVVPFSAKEQALAANGGQPLSPQVQARLLKAAGPGSRASAELITPAAVASGGAGLKPARPGLAVREAARPSSPAGFVSHDVAGRHAFATGTTSATATPTPGAAHVGGPGRERAAHPAAPAATPPPVPTVEETRRHVGPPVHTPPPTPTPRPTVPARVIHPAGPPTVMRVPGPRPASPDRTPTPVPTHPELTQVHRVAKPTPTPVPTHVAPTQVRRVPRRTPTPTPAAKEE